jgi:dTDP-4-amino-4,6-dideoxygalactose transaminase
MYKYTLFNKKEYTINTADFQRPDYDFSREIKIEKDFAKYIGAEFACVAYSADILLYYILDATSMALYRNSPGARFHTAFLPSNCNMAMANSVLNSSIPCCWDDSPDWVGNPYTILDTSPIINYHKFTNKAQKQVVGNCYSCKEEESDDGFKVMYIDQYMEEGHFEKMSSGGKRCFAVYSFDSEQPMSGGGGAILVSNEEQTMSYVKNKIHKGMDYATSSMDSAMKFQEMNPEVDRKIAKEMGVDKVKGAENRANIQAVARQEAERQQDIFHASRAGLSSKKMYNAEISSANHEPFQFLLPLGGLSMHASPLQCYMAIEGLSQIKEKNSKLKKLRNKYNKSFGAKNNSCNVYKLEVKDKQTFISKMLESGIEVGLGYPSMHDKFALPIITPRDMKKTELYQQKTVLIPFHEGLSTKDSNFIIKQCLEYK